MSKVARNHVLKVRLNDPEQQKLERNATRAQLSVAEFVRSWVNSLPECKSDQRSDKKMESG